MSDVLSSLLCLAPVAGDGPREIAIRRAETSGMAVDIEGQAARNHRQLVLRLQRRMDENRTDLGSKHEPGIGDRVVEALLSHPIDGEKQSASSRVPDRESKNSGEQIKRPLAIPFPRVGDHL